jgi:hypothetical protein
MISCCCIDVDDPAEVECITYPRARKSHECCECDDGIQSGQVYQLAKLLFDGEWTTYRTCSPCAAIRRDLLPCGHYYGRLAEDTSECIGFDYREMPDDE